MDETPAQLIQYVNTGEVVTGGIETMLNSGAIGSCVVITAFDPVKHVGAMAHVMLPGKSPVNNQFPATRYAFDAMEELFTQLKTFEINPEHIEICLVGGANVLNRENDTIGQDNLDSIETLLFEKQLEIKAKTTGGFERRTVLFDIKKGCIYYTLGDSRQKTLWITGNKQENIW